MAELGNKTQSESILVDFDRKGWDEERKEYKVIEDLYPDDPFEFFSQVYKVADSTKLVEYVDEFGRTRLVKPEEKATLDAEREETMQLFLKLQEESAGPSHYDAGKEVRTKGIGFFKFAQDESERQRQMKALDDLRQNTTEERERYLLQKEQRRIRIKFRLEAIKLRREKFSGGDVKGI